MGQKSIEAIQDEFKLNGLETEVIQRLLIQLLEHPSPPSLTEKYW